MSALAIVLGGLAALFLVALVVRAIQRVWIHFGLTLCLLLLGCAMPPGVAQAAGTTSGGSCAAMPACTTEAQCSGWGAACCAAPTFAICVGSDAGHDVCGCYGSMPCPVQIGNCHGLGCVDDLTQDPNCGSCGFDCAKTGQACAAVGPDVFGCVSKDGGA